MPPDSTQHTLIQFAYDSGQGGFVFHVSWILTAILAALLLMILGIWFRRKALLQGWFVETASFQVGAETSLKVDIRRDHATLHFANRVLAELTTRKAALPFDPKHDVLTEVYDSWYQLFQAIREEIKAMPGHTLHDTKRSGPLLHLTRRILNEGMRPHLTQYQARFRRWYEDEAAKPENQGKSPQDIQSTYPGMHDLIQHMDQVTTQLRQFVAALEDFLKVEEKHRFASKP